MNTNTLINASWFWAWFVGSQQQGEQLDYRQLWDEFHLWLVLNFGELAEELEDNMGDMTLCPDPVWSTITPMPLRRYAN